MYEALIGAGLGLAGTGYNIRADRQDARARNNALNQLDAAIAQQSEAESIARRQTQENQTDLSRRRYAALDDMFTRFSAPTQVDPRMAARLRDAAVTDAPQTQWGERAAVPYNARTANLTAMAGDVAQQSSQMQQRNNAMSGFSRADQRFGIEGQDYNAMAGLEAAVRQRAWQYRQMQLQRMFDEAQNAGDRSRLTGAVLGGAGQLAGAMGSGRTAAPTQGR